MEILVEPVVSLVVERIGNWLVGEAKLSTQVRSDIEEIQRDLRWMTSILRNGNAEHKEVATWHNFVVEIEDIAYDAQDVIETFVLTIAMPMRDRRRGTIPPYFLKRCACIFKEFLDRRNIGSQIKGIRIRVSQLSARLQTYGSIRSVAEGGQSSSSAQERARLLRRTYSHVVEDDFIELENVVKELVGHLVNEDADNYQTVCICGMGGLGKTTLAQKVYNHNDVKRHFDYLAWACISQQLQKQDILQGILIKFFPEKEEEIRRKGDADLTRQLHQVQLDKKCLIVLDDIWEQGDWDILKSAFPTRSKILLTTRNKELALHVNWNRHGFLHEPRLLKEGEAWELLQKKAFRRAHGSSDNRPDKKIEELGIKMVRHCGGLPLAVVVLGGILVTKHTEEEWEKVHRNINSLISKGTSTVRQEDGGGVSGVLGLSYDDLPYQLKRCFLYLGSFPEDSRIELEKLYELWIAEDLILSADREREDTMMDVAERYLSELANRYMVHLGVEESMDIFGKYESLKYYRLHDMMRELSKSRSKEEIFFNVIDSEKISSSSSSNAKVRRVAIHGHLGKEEDYGDWLSTQYYLRSVLLFGDNAFIPIINSWHWKDLKVLRVVHLEVRKLKKLPKAIGKLIHLRYLSLKGCKGLVSLPSSIGNLRCLQTLDLRGNDFMRIPNVLWKIKSLTHLYLCEYIKRKGKKMRLSGLGKLEILENFDSRTCDVKDLFNLKNLRNLNAYINCDDDVVLADFVNYVSSPASRLRYSLINTNHDFKSEEEVTVLRKLIGCGHLNTLRLFGVIGGGKLPAVHPFLPSLTALSLENSQLKEDPMLTLGKLHNLTHLSLSYRSFEIAEMVCSEEGFPQLKFLQLFHLGNLKKWRVDKGAMPNLFRLKIIHCRRLMKVPDGLEFISTLQDLIIRSMPYEFVRRLGGEDQYKIQHVPNIQYSHSED